MQNTGRFGLLGPALLIGVAFMSSALITPLYTLYQQAFGFSEITLTLIYAAYVAGNLAALLFFGKLSDAIARRRVALASIGAGALCVVFFVFATSTAWLFAGRILSGVFVGLSSATCTAWLADLTQDSDRATVAATVANCFGFAVGPLAAGILAQYAADPLKTPFYAYAPLLAITAMLVVLTRETVERRRKFGLADLKPRVGVPKELLGQFAAPAVCAFATYALVGYYAGLIPTILAQSLHRTQPIAGGAIVFEIAFLAGIITLMTRTVESRTGMLAGLVLLLPSVALVLVAQAERSMPMLLLAAALAAACWGIGIRASLQVVNAIAPADRRAEMASSYYVAGFIGNSIPIIGIGVLATIANPFIASVTFGCVIAAFALAALYAGLRFSPVSS